MTQPSRDLLARFTAAYPGKKKLCLGMRSQRKCPLLDLNVSVVRYFLPDADNTNLTFYQQVLTGEKKCLSLDSVHPEVVPTFPEITVKNLYAALQKDPKTLEFIPDQTSGKKLKLQKSFLWTLICTLRPEWAKALVKACVDSRNKLCQDELASRKMIPISAEVIQKLLDCDFVHCKCFLILIYLSIQSASTKTRVTVLTDARTRKPPTKKRSYQLAFGVDMDSSFQKSYAD